MILLLLGLCFADPADALDPVTRPFFERAESRAEARAWSQAASLYRLVLTKDPAFLPAVLGLGRCLEAERRDGEAEALYRQHAGEADAVEALARLLEPRDTAQALLLWKQLETLRLGDPGPYLAQARLGVRADLDAALAAWSTYQVLLQGEPPDGPTLIELVVALIAAQRRDEAIDMLQVYLELFPEGAAADEARRRLDRLDVEREAAALLLGGSTPLTSEQSERASGVARLLQAGRVDEAQATARALVAAAPRSAEAHGQLAEVLVAADAWAEAETHAVIARDLAPDDATARLRLGRLLVDAYGGRRDAEAAEELREAAALRPLEARIHYSLGLVEQALGNWDAAASAYSQVIELAPGGADAAGARARITSLQRVAPPAPAAPPRPSELPAEAEHHYRVALALLSRQRAEEASAELDLALEVAPDATLLLNKRAALDRRRGDAGAALRRWRQSLAVDPTQGAVHLELGDLAAVSGDTLSATAAWEAAARYGVADAWYLLARQAEARGEWSEVRTLLDAWFARASQDSPYRLGATELRDEARRRALVIRVGLGSALLLGIGLPLLIWVRRRTAGQLRDLLDSAPSSWHDAARAIARLRHEVLKHNTTVLPDVADALDAGNSLPWLALQPRLGMLRERFASQLDVLEDLGKIHGLRLDLRRRDPLLAPMWRGMVRLSRVKRPSAAELRSISAAVNGVGYRALDQIVREICVLPVTVELVRGVYTRVCHEPGIAGTEVPELRVLQNDEETDPRAHTVRMFRDDLEDILANLLRNALSAGARHLYLAIGEVDDPITGVGSVELRLIDDAPGALTQTMIRSRYIGRGLGLAVDLLNRHGGAIRVESTGIEGEKAVIVELPRVEPAPVEVEWTR